MSNKLTVRPILNRLLRRIQAADRIKVFQEKYGADIEKEVVGLATDQSLDHRLRESLSIHDQFGLTKEIEQMSEELHGIGETELANQFQALLKGVDEAGGDEQIPMSRLRQLVELHCPDDENGKAERQNQQTAPPISIDDVAYSSDFRSMRWLGVSYSFTSNQASVVRLLYDNWVAGTPDVSNETLLNAVDHYAPPTRLTNLFRGHPAWRKMIVAGGTKGSHRLAPPVRKNS